MKFGMKIPENFMEKIEIKNLLNSLLSYFVEVTS